MASIHSLNHVSFSQDNSVQFMAKTTVSKAVHVFFSVHPTEHEGWKVEVKAWE